MCLAVPMKVVQINGEFGIAELGGLRRKVNLQLLPQIKVGDYIIVHAGFGIERLDTQEAEETLKVINEIP